MISYKEWKQINENLGYSFPIGTGTTQKIGELQNRWNEMGMMPTPKLGDDMGGDDMGGDDMGMGMMPKKKKKPLAPMGDELGSGEGDVEPGDTADLDDMGDEDMDDELDSDDEGDDMGDEDMGDEEGGEEEGMDEPMDKPMGKPMMKKKPPMSAMMMKKKMKKEDREFFNNLKKQAGGTYFQLDEEGKWVPVTEDAVIAPTDPNKDIAEPQAGEVGFAPTGRLGSNFNEWAAKYKK